MVNRKVFIFLVLMLCSFGANATSGNTDKYGCHTITVGYLGLYEPLGYHCHSQNGSYNPTLYLGAGITAEYSPIMLVHSLGLYRTEYDAGFFTSLGVFNTTFYHSNNFKASANLAVTVYSSMTMKHIDIRYAPTVSVDLENNWSVDTALVGGAGRGLAGAVTLSKHFKVY